RRGPGPCATAGRPGRAVDLPAAGRAAGAGGLRAGSPRAAGVHGPWPVRSGSAAARRRGGGAGLAHARLRRRVAHLPDAARGLRRRDPRPRQLDDGPLRGRLTWSWRRARATMAASVASGGSAMGTEPMRVLIADDEPLARQR